MSRECHNNKPQPTPDTKMKRQRTEINPCKINKQKHEKHTSSAGINGFQTQYMHYSDTTKIKINHYDQTKKSTLG